MDVFGLPKPLKMLEYFKSWTFTRWIYAGLGTYLVAAGIMDGQWIGALFGTYFAAMGIFGFGCAAGNCIPKSYSNKPVQDLDQLQVDYQEIKTKNHGNNN
jgi:hypothetical protein